MATTLTAEIAGLGIVRSASRDEIKHVLSVTRSVSERFTSSDDLGIVTDQALSFGPITSAKLLIIESDVDISVKLNGIATALAACRLLVLVGTFTAATVTTTAATRVVWTVAG